VIHIKKCGSFNIKELEFIGKGIHGKVYKIDSERCIKIFKKNEFFQKELETLQMAQGNAHFPKLYEWGDGYIIREYIDGIELDKYLKKNPLTIELSRKILNLYEAMKEVGFSRLDTVLFHIFVTKNGDLKLIDTARVMKETTAYPKLLLKDLKSLKCKDEFLKHVKTLRYDLYQSWTNID
jgi:predicted Ser/Thr protein kinase